MSGRSGTATCALGANPSAIKRGRRLPYCLLLIALLLGAAILQKDGGAGFPTAKPRSNAQWAHLYAALPLSFEANRGQTDPSVNFLSRGQGYTLFLTGHEAVLTLRITRRPAARGQKPAGFGRLRSVYKLLGANAHAAVTGSRRVARQGQLLHRQRPQQMAHECSHLRKGQVRKRLSRRRPGLLRHPGGRT